MLLCSWLAGSGLPGGGGKEAALGSGCSGLPCGPPGQVQGHKQVAAHMRGGSHTTGALTPVSPASQGAEALGQSPGWSFLAQCPQRLWATACLCRPPFSQLEGEGLGWSGQMRPVTPSGSPESSCQNRPLEQSQDPSPVHLERQPLRVGRKNLQQDKMCGKDSPTGGSERAGPHPGSRSTALWALRDAEARVGCREHPGRILLPPWQQVLTRIPLPREARHLHRSPVLPQWHAQPPATSFSCKPSPPQGSPGSQASLLSSLQPVGLVS